jgi:hypothetical protein
MFQEFSFTTRQINNYYQMAQRDLKIAKDSEIPEVIFVFCYNGFLKSAITVCAKKGLRVKARPGHHVALIKKMSVILKSPKIKKIGEEMRNKRNKDIYGGGVLISLKEAKAYLGFTMEVYDKVEEYIKDNPRLPLKKN